MTSSGKSILPFGSKPIWLIVVAMLAASMACAPINIFQEIARPEAVWYVSTSGDDSQDCQSEVTACRTLQAAADKAVDGGRVQIAAGTYDENDIQLGDKSLQIQGAGEGVTIFDGSSVDAVLRIHSPSGRSATAEAINIGIDGLTIQGGQAEEIGGGGVDIIGNSPLNVTLSSSTIQFNEGHNAGGVSVNCRELDNTNVQLLGVSLLDNVNPSPNQDGSALTNLACQVEIRNSLISGNIGGRAALFNFGSILTIAGSQINDNDRDALYTDTEAIVGASQIERNGGDGITNAGGELVVSASTIQANSGNGILATPGFGARGTVEVNGSSILNNEIDSGGGLAIYAHASGVLNQDSVVSITDTLIQGNQYGVVAIGSNAGGGGETTLSRSAVLDSFFQGVVINGGNQFTILNSTLSGNRSGGHGGAGINTNHVPVGFEGVAPSLDRTRVRIDHTTIAQNLGQGMRVGENSEVIIQNTIIADNDSGDQCEARRSPISDIPSGIIVSEGNNIASDGTCYLYSPGGLSDYHDMPNTDPLLEPLANNGGSTPTFALMPESPAIDAAQGDDFNPTDLCPGVDQRGVERPQGEWCDIGAFELEEEIGVIRIPLTEGTEASGTTTAVPTGLVAEQVGCLAVPGLGADVIQTLAAGASVELDARSGDGAWFRSRTDQCWLPQAELEVSGPIEALPIAELPAISVNFNADSYSLEQGTCTRLRWLVMNASSYLLDGEEVDSTGSQQVCPANSQIYTLLASNLAEEVERTVTVEVSQDQAPPAAPEQLHITDYVCNDQEFSLTLNWLDASENEDGFRVYRDGELIATLGSGASQYADEPPFGESLDYEVEAFNSAGSSDRISVENGGCIF